MLIQLHFKNKKGDVVRCTQLEEPISRKAMEDEIKKAREDFKDQELEWIAHDETSPGFLLVSN